MVCNEVS